MKKIHSRIKRRWNLRTHKSRYYFFHPKAKKHRPKTFKTEEAAHVWASKQGLKQGQYDLKKAKRNKKFQVLIKEQ